MQQTLMTQELPETIRGMWWSRGGTPNTLIMSVIRRKVLEASGSVEITRERESRDQQAKRQSRQKRMRKYKKACAARDAKIPPWLRTLAE